MPHKIPWPKKDGEESFEGRTFLTEEEWKPYRRRPPQRYPRQGKQPAKSCQVCRQPPSAGNLLQYAHRISARHGVWYLALTPEVFDSEKHIVWGPLKMC